jgi:hypothetical protein
MKTAVASQRELTDLILGSRPVIATDSTAIQPRAIQAFRRIIERRRRWWHLIAHKPKQIRFNHWYKLRF